MIMQLHINNLQFTGQLYTLNIIHTEDFPREGQHNVLETQKSSFVWENWKYCEGKTEKYVCGVCYQGNVCF